MANYSFLTRRFFVLVLVGSFLSSTCLFGQNIITTYAGTGVGAFSGDGGLPAAAQIKLPSDIHFDAAGNKYIVDQGNHCVRKVDVATGFISTIIGTGGVSGFSGDGGLATAAKLNMPATVCLDNAGNLYVTDGSNQRIRKVTAATGIISTIAGTGVSGYSGDGGLATAAQLKDPYGLVVDSNGDILWSEFGNSIVRKLTVSTGIISTYAGTGVAGSTGDGGVATGATFNFLRDICIDGSNNIFIADRISYKIRKITASTSIVTTIAGVGTFGSTGDGGLATSAKIRTPFGVCVDASGNVYIADTGNNKIRKITTSTGIIATFAGTGVSGFSGDGGDPVLAKLNFPEAIFSDGSYIYVADNGNNRIRRIEIIPIVLPVSLIEFTAIVNSENKVELNWSTASEYNNNYFEVERSADGKNWELLSTVKSKGNVSDGNIYRELDVSPFNGISYYRLSQIDNNGDKQALSLQSIQVKSIVSIFPNPVNGESLTVLLNLNQNTNVVLKWIDNTGKIIQSEENILSKDENYLSVTTNQLNPGIYSLSIQIGENIPQVEKVMIVK